MENFNNVANTSVNLSSWNSKDSNALYATNGQINGSFVNPTGDWYPDNVYRYYNNYVYPTVYFEKSKVEQAFKIVKILIEKKIISGEITVGRFIELINEISKEI